MDTVFSLLSALAGAGSVMKAVAASIGLAVAICTITYLWTTARYHHTMRRNNNPNTVDIRPAILPYAIPWLGSTLSFLTPHPGKFFRGVLSWHPPELGYFGIVVAGQVNHIVYSSRAVQAMFKVKNSVAHRDHFNFDVMTKPFGMSMPDHDKLVGLGMNRKREMDEEMNQEFLLRQSAVNELTGKYVEFLRQELGRWGKKGMAQSHATDNDETLVVDFYAWLQSRMFGPSATAFLGARVMDTYPELASDFWRFDNGWVDMLFGIPRRLRPEPYDIRDRLIANMTRWVESGDALIAADSSGQRDGPNPHKPEDEWEPIWGSRLSQHRQARFIREGISAKGRASLELGFMFGLSSNAIPATGWMLMHIMDPAKPELLPRLLKEVRRAVIPPSSSDAGAASTIPIEDLDLDINILIAQPLLLSVYQEVMRMYVDVLVARKAEQDFRLPVDDTTPDGRPRTLLIKKGETIFAPSIISHYDSGLFMDPPPSVFDPYRFLVPTSTTEKGSEEKTRQNLDKDEYTFSTASLSHKLWPYGGGKTICPGRVFAKQEMLATVAMVLLGFEISADDRDSYAVPGLPKLASGSGAMAPGGDVRVKIKRRQAQA